MESANVNLVVFKYLHSPMKIPDATIHTTRHIENMVVFSPRLSRPGNVSASVQQLFPSGENLHVNCPPADSIRAARQNSLPSNHSNTPTVGLQEQWTSPSTQRDYPSHKAADTPAPVCCKETTAAHQAHHSDETVEVQVLTDRVPPEKYHEKMLIELSGEQSPCGGTGHAVIRDALQRDRKESGFSDRASLFTYMARTFLEGGQESGTSSKRPSRREP